MSRRSHQVESLVLVVPKSERVPISRTWYMPPLGLMSIAAMLRRWVPWVRVTLVNEELLSGGSLVETVMREDPDLVGLTCSVGSYRSALALAREIKDRGCPRVILGGPYVSVLWSQCLRNRGYVDAVCVGDGEWPVVEIARGRAYAEIAGLASRGSDGEPVLVPPKDHPLSIYPDPDWTTVDAAAYQAGYRRESGDPDAVLGATYSMKGCRWNERTGGCVFCGLCQPRLRVRTPARVWAEIHRLASCYGVNHVWDVSPSITSDPSWLHEFALRRTDGDEFHLHAYARASEINEATAGWLEIAGFEEIFVGIESGDDRVLKTAGKGVTAQRNLQAARLLSEKGIRVFASLCLGLPGEAADSLQRTLEHTEQLLALDATTISVCLMTPYPGSKAFEMFLSHARTPETYRARDVFDWDEVKWQWMEFFCQCSRQEILDYAARIGELAPNLEEDNYTYVKQEYRV